MTLFRRVLPKRENVRYYDLVFPRNLFDKQHFKVRDVGPSTVAERR